jgi:hypothetical protein
MKRGISILAAAAACALFVPANALAWGANGHRITGEIAQRHLSLGATQALSDLAGRKSLALLSTWADFIRSTPAWDCAVPWHYVNIGDTQDFKQGLKRPNSTNRTCAGLVDRLDLPKNLISAIDYFTAIVAGDESKSSGFAEFLEETGAAPYDGSLRLTALAFLVHFVGDLHQPLHVGRADDRGGNSITTNWFDEIKNLHSIWDSGLIDSERLSYTEFVDFLEQELGGTEDSAPGSEVADWARESFDYRAHLYEIWGRTDRDNYLPDLSYSYAAEHIGMVKERLYWGGRRLAELLESILE